MEVKKLPKNIWELLEKLKRDQVPQEQYKYKIDEFLELKAREHGIPYAGHFELTPFCNLDCKMCYVHLRKDQMHGAKLLEVEQWKNLMRQAKEAGMRVATLSGGECLTYPGFEELYLYLYDLGVEVNVFTNGILLDEERIEFFLKHPPRLIQISLYGNNEECYEKVTGSRKFQIVYDHIKAVIAARLNLRIAITPSVFMDEYVEEILELCHGLGVPYTINNELFTPREETERSQTTIDLPFERYCEIFQKDFSLYGREMIPVAEEKLPPVGGGKIETTKKGLLCGAGRSCFSICWDGALQPCGQFAHVKSYPLTDGFIKAWKEINEWAESYPRIAKCEGCAYADICSPCAAAMAQYTTPGTCYEPWCILTREKVKCGLIHTIQCD